jgi:serine phosphatase RsbU (regulator of sigma subunit)
LTDSLQRSLLPDKLPEVQGVEIEATYLPVGPGAESGGDWYDAIHVVDGVAVAIGDVAGRGAAASELAARVRDVVRMELAAGHAPSELLAVANAVVAAGSREMATVLVAVLDAQTGVLRAANAGHPPALIRRRGGVVEEWDAARGLPLGVRDDAVFEEAATRLERGEVVLLYTDGLVERRGREVGEGLAMMKAAVPEIAPAAGVRTAVIEAMIGDQEHDDEVAVLALGRPG